MRQTPTFRKLTFFLSIFLFLFTFQVHASGANRPDLGAEATVADAPMEGSVQMTGEGSAYAHIDPENLVPKAQLEKALNYFEQNKSKLKNQEYIVLIDYSKHNSKERFFLIDTQSGQVETFLVAHGKGSDPSGSGNASLFSDTDMSLMSSLGFFITAETYYGSNGFSLKLDGQSSTNSNARARAIVIHGADYVNQGSVGRSWGCPALEMRHYQDVIGRIKGGALVYSFN